MKDGTLPRTSIFLWELSKSLGMRGIYTRSIRTSIS